MDLPEEITVYAQDAQHLRVASGDALILRSMNCDTTQEHTLDSCLRQRTQVVQDRTACIRVRVALHLHANMCHIIIIKML